MIINNPGGGGGISPEILTDLNDIIVRNAVEPVRAPGLLRSIGTFIGTMSRSTAGAQVITGVGFSPSMVFFICCDSSSGEQNFSWGADDGTLHNFIYLFNDGSQTGAGNYASVYIYRDVGNRLRGLITALSADGFTITWTIWGACGVSGYFVALP